MSAACAGAPCVAEWLIAAVTDIQCSKEAFVIGVCCTVATIGPDEVCATGAALPGWPAAVTTVVVVFAPPPQPASAAIPISAASAADATALLPMH